MQNQGRLLQLACLSAILAPAHTQNASNPFANITCAANISDYYLCSLPEPEPPTCGELCEAPAEEQCGELCEAPAEEQCGELCAPAIEDTCDDLCAPPAPPIDAACLGILCTPPPPPAPACNDILCAKPSPPPAPVGCGIDALCGPLPDENLAECTGILCTPPSPPPLTCLIDVFEAQCASPSPPPPSPSPPPPLPPFPTSAVVQTIITFTAVVPGTVTTFDREGYKAALARTMVSQGVTAAMIQLRVEAASVRVTSQIIDPPNAAAVFNRLAVVTASAQTLSNALGIPIASIAQAPVTVRVQGPAAPPASPSPPPPSPSPPPPFPPLSSALGGGGEGLSTGGAIAIGVVLGSIVLLASCIYFYAKRGGTVDASKPSPAKKTKEEALSADKESKDVVSTVISSSAVDIEMAGGRTAANLDVKPQDDAPGSIPPSSPTSEEGAPAVASAGSIELTEIKRSPETELDLPAAQSTADI